MAALTDLALRLRLQRNRLLEQDAFGTEEPIIEPEALPLPQFDHEFDYEQRRAGELIEALDHALRSENWPPPAAASGGDGAGGNYVYGLIPRRAPMRQIVRGFLQPVRYVPLVESVPENVALFLRIMLPGGDDGLEREEHGGVKWHFHYIDVHHRRSDVILSFDTRWKIVEPAKGLDRLRPLFVERHAHGKSKFTAQPGRWETAKRTSMYEICSRDLHKGVEHFRCAKNGSDAVWPRHATLTPHASSQLNAGRTAGSGKGKKNGR
ncbi:hypothetical protein [Novosphingobium sp. FKTRR1]|uniref:hypothetical protein n=1 Tax=Novosphingobium sp. FKTRR1 TaxID=2879118 RepID=UPI001CF0AF4B|nr:hypothetical protein [Novosphingobium sp. FKTRR1]